MQNSETIQRMIRELKSRTELLAEQLPSLSGKRLRDTEREIRAMQVMLRHYEEKLVSQIPRMSVAESSSSEPDSQAS